MKRTVRDREEHSCPIRPPLGNVIGQSLADLRRILHFDATNSQKRSLGHPALSLVSVATQAVPLDPDILGVTLDELAGRKESAEPQIHNAELHRLYRKVDQLSDQDQQALVIVLDSLVKRS